MTWGYLDLIVIHQVCICTDELNPEIPESKINTMMRCSIRWFYRHNLGILDFGETSAMIPDKTLTCAWVSTPLQIETMMSSFRFQPGRID